MTDRSSLCILKLFCLAALVELDSTANANSCDAPHKGVNDETSLLQLSKVVRRGSGSWMTQEEVVEKLTKVLRQFGPAFGPTLDGMDGAWQVKVPRIASELSSVSLQDLPLQSLSWSHPYSQIWPDSSCRNFGLRHAGLAACKEMCESSRNMGCNTININPSTRDCILRACPIPIPRPYLVQHGYYGYAMQKREDASAKASVDEASSTIRGQPTSAGAIPTGSEVSVQDLANFYRHRGIEFSDSWSNHSWSKSRRYVRYPSIGKADHIQPQTEMQLITALIDQVDEDCRSLINHYKANCNVYVTSGFATNDKNGEEHVELTLGVSQEYHSLAGLQQDVWGSERCIQYDCHISFPDIWALKTVIWDGAAGPYPTVCWLPNQQPQPPYNATGPVCGVNPPSRIDIQGRNVAEAKQRAESKISLVDPPQWPHH